MTTFNQKFSELVEVTMAVQQVKSERDNDENIMDIDESAKSQDFFQDSNTTRKKYTNTPIKSRNF